MFASRLQSAAALCVVLAAGSAQAAVITFEGGLDPTFTYSGVTTGTTPISTVSGYNNVAAATGSVTVAFNPSEVSPSSLFIAGGPSSTFTLNSFVIAGAWGSQTLTIEGLNDGGVLFSSLLPVSLTPIVFAPEWVGIDQLRIATGPDFIQDVTLGGSGQHWALDNVTINEATVPNQATVPEPGTLALLAAGMLGFAARRRK